MRFRSGFDLMALRMVAQRSTSSWTRKTSIIVHGKVEEGARFGGAFVVVCREVSEAGGALSTGWGAVKVAAGWRVLIPPGAGGGSGEGASGVSASWVAFISLGVSGRRS